MFDVMSIFLITAIMSLILTADWFEGDDSREVYDDDEDGNGLPTPSEDDGIIEGTSLGDQLFGWRLDDDALTDTTTPNDTLSGLAGDDALFGGNGNDTLLGGDGNDQLTGGTGDDALTGDDGLDQFLFQTGDGDDTITDLALGEAIAIDGLLAPPTITDDGTDSLISDGAGTNITVLGVIRSELSVGAPDSDGVTLIERVVVPVTAATIGGNTTGDVTEDDAATLVAIGTLTVTDPNPGEAVFTAQTGTAGTYGSFDLGTDGTWSYAADNTQAAIQDLNTGDTLTDSFTAVTADGTTQAVTITINGLDEPIAAVELAAVQMDADNSGFVINGVSASDRSGLSVSGAGDVNGDGLDDLIVGAGGDDPNGSGSGASFVVFGKAAGTTVELSAVEAGTGGFVINGVSAFDGSGFSVSGAGDVNGDGLDDLIVGAYADDPNGSYSGASFVVFGKADGTAVELSAVEAGTGGFVINGVSASDYAGVSVSGAGDVNGDGLDDLIVGALGDDPNGSSSGASFVVFGKADTTAVELSAVEAGTGGFVINGVSAFDGSGLSVSGAGDVNGDGLDDLIVGARYDDPNGLSSGASFVVFGKADGTAVELSAVEAGTGGFVINGVSASDRSGISVSGAGDVNGDGLGDLIVGAYLDDPNGSSGSGASFVVFGKADTTAVELSAVETGTGGFVINGVAENDRSGNSVSGAGDVNGDGLDDLIVGARFDDPNGSSSGASFVVFGKADTTAIELSTVEAGTGGFVINGVSASDSSGYSVSGAGDVNGDGLDDLIVGALGDDPNGSSSGASFVVFGGNVTFDVDVPGTSGADTLTGDAADEIIYGAAGDDTVNGGGGLDRLSGGQGADDFVITDDTGTATVIDFSIRDGDQIDVSDFGFADFATFQSALAGLDYQGNVVGPELTVKATRITLDADTFMILEGVKPSELTAAQVIL